MLFLTLIAAGCGQPQAERHYTEIVPAEDNSMPASAVSATDMPYAWKVPAGWVQRPGEGMRLASFSREDDAKAIDCSIVSLDGMAGGLEANLARWIGQLSLGASAENLERLMNAAQTVKTTAGLEGKIFDFVVLVPEANDKSIIAAVFSTEHSTVFIKMTGTGEKIQQERSNFDALVKSFIVQ